MKASSPPVLTLATFPQAATPYYAERLRAHGTRLPHLATWPTLPICPSAARSALCRWSPSRAFSWGAMFISYGFSVATVLLIGALLYWFAGGPGGWAYVLTVAVFALLLAPSALRYPRTLMLYWFGRARYRYDAGWQRSKLTAA